MVTQTEIARRVGLDVSSVNKILCRTPGPVFKQSTIDIVLRVAKKMGYKLDRETKVSLREDVKSLKAALTDVYNQYFAMGGRVLKPETLATIQKHFQQMGSRAKSSTG